MPLLNLTDARFEKLRTQCLGVAWMLEDAIVPTDDTAALAGALRNAGVHESHIAKLTGVEPERPEIIVTVNGGVAEVAAVSRDVLVHFYDFDNIGTGDKPDHDGTVETAHPRFAERLKEIQEEADEEYPGDAIEPLPGPDSSEIGVHATRNGASYTGTLEFFLEMVVLIISTGERTLARNAMIEQREHELHGWKLVRDLDSEDPAKTGEEVSHGRS